MTSGVGGSFHRRKSKTVAHSDRAAEVLLRTARSVDDSDVSAMCDSRLHSRSAAVPTTEAISTGQVPNSGMSPRNAGSGQTLISSLYFGRKFFLILI